MKTIFGDDDGMCLRPETSPELGDRYLVRKGGVLVFTGEAEGDLKSATQRDQADRDETVAGIKLTRNPRPRAKQ